MELKVLPVYWSQVYLNVGIQLRLKLQWLNLSLLDQSFFLNDELVFLDHGLNRLLNLIILLIDYWALLLKGCVHLA